MRFSHPVLLRIGVRGPRPFHGNALLWNMRSVGRGLLTLATWFGVLTPDSILRPVRYQANTNIDFVVVAHEDDWQLFMGDAIERRAAEGDSLTFVYLTAGDDGREPAYWQTRERAALAATRVAIGAQAGEPAARCS